MQGLFARYQGFSILHKAFNRGRNLDDKQKRAGITSS